MHRPPAPSAQDNSCELLAEEDILPDNFWELAPEDQTVSMALCYSQSVIFTPREVLSQNAVLVAWERGEISGMDALDYLECHELMDYDALLGGYLALLRARAAVR